MVQTKIQEGLRILEIMASTVAKAVIGSKVKSLTEGVEGVLGIDEKSSQADAEAQAKYAERKLNEKRKKKDQQRMEEKQELHKEKEKERQRIRDKYKVPSEQQIQEQRITQEDPSSSKKCSLQ